MSKIKIEIPSHITLARNSTAKLLALDSSDHVLTLMVADTFRISAKVDSSISIDDLTRFYGEAKGKNLTLDPLGTLSMKDQPSTGEATPKKSGCTSDDMAAFRKSKCFSVM